MQEERGSPHLQQEVQVYESSSDFASHSSTCRENWVGVMVVVREVREVRRVGEEVTQLEVSEVEQGE